METADPRRGATYLVLIERFGPPQQCQSREKQQTILHGLADISTWAAQQTDEVKEAYRWSMENFIGVMEDAVTRQENSNKVMEHYRTFPQPPKPAED